MKLNAIEDAAGKAGLFTLSLRWVLGWTYFSAFWRRLILDNKLIPEEAGYIGEKFNHFLPNALGIKPLIEYLVSNPEVLQASMVVFTIIEAIVGLFMILGLFTRLMSAGVVLLAMGILLGAGWLGTTCLDEWQIGVLGVAGGFTVFLTGGGSWSLDAALQRRGSAFTGSGWFRWLGSGELRFKGFVPVVAGISVSVLALTLFTNQYFHGGVWGKLHNKSVRPVVEISQISRTGSALTFQLMRTEGADVYGSFLIGIQILDERGQVVMELAQEELSRFPPERITNHYVSKIRPGKHSLVLPLGARADITLGLNGRTLRPGYSLKLIDVSGLEWQAKIN